MTIQTTLKASMSLGAIVLLMLSRGVPGAFAGKPYIFGAGILLIAVVAVMLIRDLLAPPEGGSMAQNVMIDPDSLPDAVIISGLNGQISVMNKAALNLFDLVTPCNNIKTLFQDWHAMLNDRMQADQVVDAVLASPDIQFTELLYLADGRTIERTTRPVFRQGQRLWTLRDITHMQLADSDSTMHRTMLEADAARMAELAEQLYHAKAELEAKQTELTRLANTDSLTGLLNRRRFTALGEQAVSGTLPGNEIWVLMMDIDHFKRINDTYGHAAGDVAIRDFAKIISDVVSELGFVGRMGGEEFAAVLPASSQDEAIRIAEAIRQATAKHQTVSDNEKFRYTASIGVAQWLVEEVTIEPALDRADQALYSAKAYGRNRVVGFEYASL